MQIGGALGWRAQGGQVLQHQPPVVAGLRERNRVQTQSQNSKNEPVLAAGRPQQPTLQTMCSAQHACGLSGCTAKLRSYLFAAAATASTRIADTVAATEDPASIR